MSIDWSKAPAGATHFGPKHDYLVEHWFRKAGGAWDLWQDGGWSPCCGGIQQLREDTLIKRPQQQPWTGEGLPPVGVPVEYQLRGASNGEWYPTQINFLSGQHVIYCDNDGDEVRNNPSEVKFRPIRTPEQIAKDEEEREILHFAATLYRDAGFSSADARVLWRWGYRKQVKP